MRLVIYPHVDSGRLAQITTAAGEMEVLNSEDEQAALAAMPEADAFFGKITPPLLAAANRLSWVQSPTASLEHYLFPELVDHPCTLTNMRGLFSDVIAEHVFGYVLCFARNLHVYLRNQAQGEWAPVGGEEARSTFAAGPGVESAMDRAHIHLSDCTLGVVGMGKIGTEVARRGLAFGMRVLGVDVEEKPAPDGVEAVWKIDRVDDLLAASDFVVICAPHTPETEGRFGSMEFERMKRTAYLINVGRGVIVRLDDLVQALSERQIAGAALDVFEIEPLPAHHPLWRMENVILTPHVAACSPHIAPRHRELLLENIRRFVAGRPLRNVADKHKWY